MYHTTNLHQKASQDNCDYDNQELAHKQDEGPNIVYNRHVDQFRHK